MKLEFKDFWIKFINSYQSLDIKFFLAIKNFAFQHAWLYSSRYSWCDIRFRITLLHEGFAQQFSDRRPPIDTTIRRLTIKARNWHIFRHRQTHQYIVNSLRVLTILAIVHEDPCWHIERKSGIPQSRIITILIALKYHAYHITIKYVQHRVRFS